MKKLRLNMNLMEHLFEVAALPVHETLSEAGIAGSTIWGWMDAEKSGDMKRKYLGGFPVLTLIDLCNVMHIPVRRLFTEEGKPDVIPLRRELVVLKSSFVPCRFDMETFRRGFGIRSGARMSVTSMLARLGVTYTAYTAWKADAKNLRVQRLLDICNEFDYDLFQFIVDKNAVTPEDEENVVQVDTSSEVEALTKENKSLLREVKSLSKELRSVSKENEVLKKEKAALMMEKSELVYELRRLKDKLRLLESGSVGMVAED